MQKHRRVALAGGSVADAKCTEHKEVLSLFCLSCQVRARSPAPAAAVVETRAPQLAICSLCKDFGAHPGHQVQPLQEAVRDGQRACAVAAATAAA